MKKAVKHKIGVGGVVISPYAKKLVNRVLDSGRISYGPFLQKFEEGFARLCDRKFAISANSGTSALQVALQAMKELYGWEDGDEVLIPAVTFVATANIVIHNGMKPIFVDVDPRTYNINPSLVTAKISKRTRAIIPVHLFGLSSDMEDIMSLARKHNLKVIEDSCETVGVTYKGKPVGSRGDISCFSTYMAHLVTTGVGGLVLTNDAKVAVKVRSLVNHGRDSIYFSIDDDKGVSGKARLVMASRRFSFESIGHSFRLTELEGALGVAQLKELPHNIRFRQRYASYLVRALAPLKIFLQFPYIPNHSDHAFMVFPLVIKDKRISRDDLIYWLENRGVETRYMSPMINQPVYRRLFGDLEPKYPVAAYINKNGFYIGCHPEIAREDGNRVIKAFHDFFHKYRDKR
ncbi:MAG: hypothetical protein A2131_02270 [Candidatus Sungbacteria bacterium GWC2_49_10]|uniref:DegT/DnrJ/EryC1/StrS aminotransferase n=1 Tax=Candidatus Sungbacteria bacterium GWC2_49_10 TaxID=1802263 RepID=A0A1G2K4U7_9BACT|nr:MAG: DegT/DnrJ/EryC1/StrS aminotransferase [Parcubacteria group bacterium GW2011_GWB1_50_9]KKW24992.1 MAG: DegT/DnrJ/EryC1/StrS aminotransferase [candidate division Kazan bacterium GW2011_GWC1_52_13]OGZ93478.1 MAG: hypothetical protein A2131_02270 [Candidatus Sungbacteria bacterium GWC2_49_10]